MVQIGHLGETPCEADKLGIDTNINNQFAVVVPEAKHVEVEWVGKKVIRLASQALAMEMKVVEQQVSGGLPAELHPRVLLMMVFWTSR